VGHVADATLFHVGVCRGEVFFLRERRLRGHAAGRRQGALLRCYAGRLAMNVVLGDGLAHGRCMHGLGLTVDEPGAVQLAQNGEDAARAVHVLEVVLR
jgi:hypothetical protein